MLDRISLFAARLRPARPWVLLLAGLLIVALAVLVAMPGPTRFEPILPLLFALLLWCVCALVFLAAFAVVPAPPGPQLRGLRRLFRRVSRGVHWLLLFMFADITVVSMWLTGRLLTEVLG